MPTASVVISTYNRSGLLAQSLRSALGQRDVDQEVIVVDNGSTDDTQGLLRSISDPRLRVVRNRQSLGATGGRNTGLVEARGEWLSILDDDDLWAPDKLRAQIDAAQRSGASWAYTGCFFIDGDLRIMGGRPPLAPEEVMRALPTKFALPGGMSNVLWRRASLDGGGLLDGRLTMTVDWDLALRLARVGPPAVVPRPLIAYRQHGGNISRRAAAFQTELDIIEDKFADLRGGEPLDRGLQHRFVGSESLRVGDRAAALRAYLAGFRAGDWGSLARCAGAVLPTRAQLAVRRRVLSDSDWMLLGRRWLDEL